MSDKSFKNELQDILQGKSRVSHGTAIQAVTHLLSRCQTACYLGKTTQQIKEEESKWIAEYCDINNFWIRESPFDNFISQGAEQRVYIKDERTVYKLNDSIYYATWTDYLNNLLLNNYYFPDTAYQLCGFYISEEQILYALVEQRFVKATGLTDLNNVRLFLKNNGFDIKKNNDYYNAELGIILKTFMKKMY